MENGPREDADGLTRPWVVGPANLIKKHRRNTTSVEVQPDTLNTVWREYSLGARPGPEAAAADSFYNYIL